MDPKRSLFIVDGHALAYRAYFAFIRNPLINSKGENTSAAFGFTRMLLLLLKKYNPSRLAVVFDSGEETDRHREFEDYKATRAEMPDDMVSQLPWIFDIVDSLGVARIMEPGVEADDLIATLARRAVEAGLDAAIVTGDKDFLQLLSDRVRIIRPEKGTALEEEVGPEFCRERWGIEPAQVVDLLALMGDTTDNIPGIKGVGEKTAVKLLAEFGSLDAIYERLDEVKPESLRGKIRAGRESALLSRDLVTLREAAVVPPLDRLAVGGMNEERVADLLLRLEFHQILKELSLGSTRDEAPRDYRPVDEAGLAGLARTLGAAREIAIDTETTSVDPMAAGLVGLSFSTEPGRAWYVPVAGAGGGSSGDSEAPGAPAGEAPADDAPRKRGRGAAVQRGLLEADGQGDLLAAAAPGAKGLSLARVREALGHVLADARIAKVGHNIKYDLLVLERHGFTVRGVSFDTMIASYVLDPERRSHSLDNLSLEFARHRKIAFNELFPPKTKVKDMRTVPLERIAEYSCEDADYTMRLKGIFENNLAALGFERLFREIEMPLCLVLERMEREGVAIDAPALEALSARLGAEIEGLTARIHEAAGEEFNVNSSRQLQRILFEKLGLRAARRTKTGFSTDEEVLGELAAGHPIAGLVLEHRQLSKLKSTYIDALPALVNAATGRIHTSFNQTVTATGRLSSSEPNLQNIPIRTELGRMIRAAFVPRRGNVLMDADYSQIELRIMAHLSGDEGFVSTFREGGDIHARTAARINDVAESGVTAEMRAQAKTINFGVIYGMGPRGLSKQLGIPLEEAKRFIDEYFEKYPGVKSYIDRSIAEARKRCYAETLLGRRRLLPDIESEDGMKRSFSERIAINTPIQGTAADMIKIAMIAIDAEMSARGMKSRMILQVHDELVFDVAQAERGAMEEIVRSGMESALALDVPVRVDLGAGANWLEAHP